MKNRNMFMVVLGMVLVFGMVLVGCDNGSSVKTYYYEMKRISTSDYNAFASTHTGGPANTFSQRKGFRQELNRYTFYDFESNSGITESELKTFSGQHGISGSDYTEAKKSLDSVGNLIIFFHYAYSNSYMIWMYVEKE